ncbi:hypothetical protein ACLOJK_025113 [Asimina triloba]
MNAAGGHKQSLHRPASESLRVSRVIPPPRRSRLKIFACLSSYRTSKDSMLLAIFFDGLSFVRDIGRWLSRFFSLARDSCLYASRHSDSSVRLRNTGNRALSPLWAPPQDIEPATLLL